MPREVQPSLSAWEIQWCDTFECDGPAVEDPDEPGTCDECGQPLGLVEVVRADRAREAIASAEGQALAATDENTSLRARIDDLIRELERRPGREALRS